MPEEVMIKVDWMGPGWYTKDTSVYQPGVVEITWLGGDHRKFPATDESDEPVSWCDREQQVFEKWFEGVHALRRKP